MPRTVGKVNDRQSAAVLEVADDVRFPGVAQAGPFPVAVIQHEQVVIKDVVATRERGSTPGPACGGGESGSAARRAGPLLGGVRGGLRRAQILDVLAHMDDGA